MLNVLSVRNWQIKNLPLKKVDGRMKLPSCHLLQMNCKSFRILHPVAVAQCNFCNALSVNRITCTLLIMNSW